MPRCQPDATPFTVINKMGGMSFIKQIRLAAEVGGAHGLFDTVTPALAESAALEFGTVLALAEQHPQFRIGERGTLTDWPSSFNAVTHIFDHAMKVREELAVQANEGTSSGAPAASNAQFTETWLWLSFSRVWHSIPVTLSQHS